MDTEKAVQTAKNAAALLERVDLKGAEVQAYIEVNQLLGGIAEGRLEVISAEDPASLLGPNSQDSDRDAEQDRPG